MKFVAVVMTAVLLFLPGPASADTQVTPDGLKPGVEIRGWEKRPDIRRPGDGGTTPSSYPDVPNIIEVCRVDSETGVDCGDPAPATGQAAQLTPGRIESAVREIEMPRLRVRVQPGDRTLVNIDTIFYTEPQTVRRTVDLLGSSIEVEAVPTGFTWHHGDGTQRTTSRPGRPYPSKDVVHAYTETAEVVRPRVDTTYTVRYRVDGGAWTGLGETLTATGPATELEVVEAAPVLVRR